MEIINLFLEISRQVLQSPNTSNIIQDLGLALLTILIPFTIAIFQKIFEAKEELSTLNLFVIIDEVFILKRVVGATFLIFLPFIFWNISPIWVRGLEVFLSVIGIIILTNTILSIYNWIKGETFNYQKNYLRKLKEPEEMKKAWVDVWKVGLSREMEEEFLYIFLSKFENFLDTLIFLKNDKNFLFKNNILEKKLNTAGVLLGDFGSFIENRPLLLLVNKKILSRLLDWDFKIWKNKYIISDSITQEKNKREDEKRLKSMLSLLNYLENVALNLSFVLQKIIKRSINEKGFYSGPLFECLQFHVEKYQKEKVGENFYLKHFFNTFCLEFFENIADSPHELEIRKYYFPAKWKITKENVIGNFLPTRFLLGEYIDWATRRIWEGNKEFDKKLNEVTQQIFPTIDFPTWAKILTFVVSPWSGSRVQTAIERKEIFGLGAYIGEAREKRIENTIELAYILFKFSKNSLEEYIQELESLKNFYPKNSLEERRQMEFLEIFKKMLNLVKNYEGK
jgi:hypothetical protein